MKKNVKRETRKSDPEVLFLMQLFGRRMAAARENRGLTQLQLSAKLGWSRITISRLENGHHKIHWPQACQLADALSVPLEAFRTKVADNDDMPDDLSVLHE